MNKWDERAPELAQLLNPAFCGMLIRNFVGAYKGKGTEAEFALSFIVLPIVLHGPTRKALPAKTNQKLHAWLEHHQEVRWRFEERFDVMMPYTREGLFFATRAEWLMVSETGMLSVGRRRLQKSSAPFSRETTQCLNAAALVGRWLASYPDTVTIFGLWGLSL